MNQNQNNSNRGGGGQNFFSQNLIIILIAAMLSLFLMNWGSEMMRDKSEEEISYDKFYEMAESGVIDSVTIGDSQISIKVKEGAEGYSQLIHYYTVTKGYDMQLLPMLRDSGVTIYNKKPDTTGAIWNAIFGLVLPFVGIFLIMSFMMRRMGGGGGIMGVGKSNAKMYMEKETGVTFADVAGEDEAKESLVEIVDFLHNPGKYRSIGAKLPKGALLVGPPGTGKTLLAKAVAGEAKVPFYSLSGSDFVEMFVGVGASRVRDLFKQAANSAPCIIFIDEIDAIGKSRDSRFGGGNDERENTLNQLLSEMDGFDASKGIMVLGATNRPEILDPALLRPGRFDRRVIVEKPDLKGRVNILKVHAKDVKLDKTVDFDEIALATSGAVGADLANMMNEAAIMAVKAGRQAVSQKDLFEAVEVVLVGKEKKDRILSMEERRIVSYHEVGHALIAAVQKHAEPVQKITIVPRTMGALGYVMQVPEEEKYLLSKKELEARLIVAFGGRAAEELVFDTVTTGAANDIEQATDIARAMVTQYGMSDELGLMGLARQQDQYLSGRTVLNCSDDTAAEIDQVVKEMLKTAYAEAKRILTENREAMDRIAAYLIEKETITGKEFMELFNGIKTSDSQAADAGSAGNESGQIETKAKSEPEAGAEIKTGAEPADGQHADRQMPAGQDADGQGTPAGNAEASDQKAEKRTSFEDAFHEMTNGRLPWEKDEEPSEKRK